MFIDVSKMEITIFDINFIKIIIIIHLLEKKRLVTHTTALIVLSDRILGGFHFLLWWPF